MDDQRVASAIRAVRVRRGLRQEDVARRAGVARATVSRLERGHFGSVSIEAIRRMAAVLDVRIDVIARWRGGELDRLLNSGHSAMHEQAARLLRNEPAWQFVPEVSYAVGWERGVVDILGWHEASRTLLIIELKTMLVDVQDLLTSMHRRRRLAPEIARSQRWDPTEVGLWVILADGTTNRRRVAAHRALLSGAFPRDGRALRRWLGSPSGSIAALSFLPNDHGANARGPITGRQRVRGRSSPRCRAQASLDRGP